MKDPNIILAQVLERLYEVEEFWNEQITGLERQLINAKLRRKSIIKLAKEIEEGVSE